MIPIMILHDPRLPDKYWERCVRELAGQGISNYQIQFPVQCPGEWPVERCINASHKNLVALAKFHNLPEACIMESDVWFPAADGWAYFIRNKPDIYDLYLAGTYHGFTAADGPHPYYYVDRPAGFHCYMIHSKYYDQFLSTPDELHIDDAQQGGLYRLCFPFAALQHKGWSANAKKEVDYNTDLLSWHKNYVYGW